jgi:Protein RETICULATA-related
VGVVCQVGNFTPAQRLGAYFYRGLQFFVIGFGSSVVGHSLTKYLVILVSSP